MDDQKNIPRNALGEPVNQDDDLDKPIPFDLDPPPAPAPAPAAPAGKQVSRTPLNLGGPAAPARTPPAGQGQRPAGAAQQAQGRPAAPAAGQKPAAIQAPRPAVRKTAPAAAVSTDRISGVKTFYTKLHPGAIPFMDEQINDWLKAHPGVRIKQTNTVVGEVQDKRTEPNIIVTVWY